MKVKLGVGIALASIAVFGLSACSAEKGVEEGAVGGGLKTAPVTSAPAATSPSPAAGMTLAEASLATASTALGTIVVDGRGRTVYEFGTDIQGSGASACTGTCATTWPAVPGGKSAPTLQGITGQVGMITGVDGKHRR